MVAKGCIYIFFIAIFLFYGYLLFIYDVYACRHVEGACLTSFHCGSCHHLSRQTVYSHLRILLTLGDDGVISCGNSQRHIVVQFVNTRWCLVIRSIIEGLFPLL